MKLARWAGRAPDKFVELALSYKRGIVSVGDVVLMDADWTFVSVKGEPRPLTERVELQVWSESQPRSV